MPRMLPSSVPHCDTSLLAPPPLPSHQGVALELTSMLPVQSRGISLSQEQIIAARRVTAHMRQEVYNTEQTTNVEPEDLGWLGTLTASSLSSNQPLLRCLGCSRVVLSTRMHIHRQLCDPIFLKTAATERPNQHTLAVPPNTAMNLVKRGSSVPKETSKPNKKQRPEQSPVETRPRTNLSKVTYPYQPELSLLEDFMSSIIDRFVFPHHLRRSLRKKGRTRRRFMDSATLELIADEELVTTSGGSLHSQQQQVSLAQHLQPRPVSSNGLTLSSTPKKFEPPVNSSHRQSGSSGSMIMGLRPGVGRQPSLSPVVIGHEQKPGNSVRQVRSLPGSSSSQQHGKATSRQGAASTPSMLGKRTLSNDERLKEIDDLNEDMPLILQRSPVVEGKLNSDKAVRKGTPPVGQGGAARRSSVMLNQGVSDWGALDAKRMSLVPKRLALPDGFPSTKLQDSSLLPKAQELSQASKKTASLNILANKG